MSSVEYVILGVFIFLSAFFSGTETAFVALGRIRLRGMAEKKIKNYEVVQKLKNDSHKLISTLLIGNNLVNIGGSALATKIAMDIWGNSGVAIATGAMTFVVLIFGEIIPKTVAMTHAEFIASRTAKIILFLTRLFIPIIFILDLFTRKIVVLFGSSQARPIITEEEIKSFVNIGEEIGSIEKDEKEMINNIFKMNDIEVKDVMIPKIDIFYIVENQLVCDVVEKIVNSGFSRVPVFDESKTKVVGILFTKDLVKAVFKEKVHKEVKDLIRPVHFIPDMKKTDSLLHEFQRLKIHMAIAVNEFGEITGLVTLEDILEEIVGEIFDETDKVKLRIKQLGKNKFEIDGEATIEEVKKKTGKILKSKTNGYTTISGYILEKLNRIPKNGEEVVFKKYKIKVLSVTDNRIKKVLLTIN
jgi:putative hemolysin